jgi:hypothetical protein
LKAPVLKTGVRETVPGVRIPPSPPDPLDPLSAARQNRVIPRGMPYLRGISHEPSMQRHQGESKPARECATARSSSRPTAACAPMWLLANGAPERHTDGAYYLEWREGPKRVRLSVGKDAADAGARRQRQEAELNAVNSGAAIVPKSQKPCASSFARSAAALRQVQEIQLRSASPS